MQAYRPRRDDPHRSWKFEHPTLGGMEGIILPCDKVVQFHSIPYATVPGRFQQATLLENLNGTDRNFKYPGYACPHTFTMGDDHSGGLYPQEPDIQTDEFKCLTNTLSVPLEHLMAFTGTERSAQQDRRRAKLPVMVYIHGGAFHVGKCDAVHDTAPLVSQSVEDAQPVIIASLQYRVGALGFLATPDGIANLGLYDQRTGLEWLQRFISGFGGDEERVTAFGESAGGYAICCHMLGHPGREKPLFTRAVVMSGVLGPLMVPVARKEADSAFHDLCEILGIAERGHAALSKLSALPVQNLVEAGDIWTAKGHLWRPVVDPEFFAHGSIIWDTVPSLLGACPWVDALIVGNTAFEGTPYLSVAASLTPSTFRSHISAGLSSSATERTMEAYGIKQDMDRTLFAHAATRWLGDVIFDAPIHALCSRLSSAPGSNKQIYRYLFDVGNPFIGAPFYAVPHHWVDVYFLFRTLQFRYPSMKLKRTSDEHSRMWVRFANGQAPWSEYGGEKKVMVVDEVEGWRETSLAEDEKRSERAWDRLERLWDAWGEKKGDKNFFPLRLTEIIGAVKE